MLEGLNISQEEENTNLIYHRDTLSEERVKRLSPYDNTTQAYFGNIYMGPVQEETGSALTSFPLVSVPRGIARGTVQLVGSLRKAGISFSAYVGDSVYDYYKGNFNREHREQFLGNLKNALDNGQITQEQYDFGVKDFQQRELEQIRLDTENYNREKEQSLLLMQHIDTHTQKIISALHIERTSREFQLLADIAESAPSTIAAMGITFALKNPTLAGVVVGALSGTATMGETAEQVLEKGGTVEQAFGVGATTGTISGALEGLGEWFLAKLWTAPMAQKATKNLLKSRLADWVTGRTASGALSKASSMAVRAGLAGAAEEGMTETLQGIVESELPRAFGFGEDFDSMFDLMSDWAYQGFVGAISGGLWGSAGTFLSARKFHKQISDRVLAAGASKEEATEVADIATEVFSKKDEEAKKSIVQQMAAIENTPQGVDAGVKAMEVLLGALSGNERTQVKERQELQGRLERQLNANLPEGKSNGENALGAAILMDAAEIESYSSGEPISSVINSYTTSIREDINPTHKEGETLHARDAEGNIIGATDNGPGKRIIKLIKGGDPVALIHEASHLLMNIAAESYARFKNQPERLHPIVLAIVDRYGVPSSNKVEGYFSEEQQEQFASDVTAGILEGVSISPEVDVMAARVRRTLHNIDTAMSKGGLKDANARAVFNKIFAKEEAPIPGKLTETRIKELKAALKNIMQGGKPSVRDLIQLAQFVQFARGARPLTKGYTLADYIAEHPEYNELTPAQKAQTLAQFGFDISDFTTAFNSQGTDMSFEENTAAMIAAMESNPENVIMTEDMEAQRSQEKQIQFNEAVEAYKEIFEGVNLRELSAAIQQLRKAGYVVMDSNTVSKAVESIERLTERAQELEKSDIQESKRLSNRAIRLAETVAVNMEMAGMDTKALRERIDKLKQTNKTNDKEAIAKEAQELISRMRTAADEMAIKYFQSESFLEENGIVPPQVSTQVLSGQIAVALMNTGSKSSVNETLDKAKLLQEVRKVLSQNKIPQPVSNRIVNELSKLSFNELTGVNSLTISQTIMDEISREYQRDMVKRIRSEWDRLVTANKKNKVNPNDKLAIEWIDKNIMQGKKTNAQLGALKFDDPIGYNQNNEPVYLNYEQKQLAESLRSVKWKEYLDKNLDSLSEYELNDTFAVGNALLADTYVMLNIMSNVTRGYPERFEAQEQERRADLTALALNYVHSRKALPRALSALDAWFGGTIGGLRSNLIALFGEEFAKRMDVLVEQRKQEKFTNDIFRDVRDKIAKITQNQSDIYLAKLKSEKPFAKAKKGTTEYLLRDYTRGQLMNLWLIGKDADGIQTLAAQFGSKEKAEAIINAIDRPSFALDRAMAIEMRQHLKQILPLVQETYLKINGVPMGVVNNYWPHNVKRKGSTEFITDMNGLFVPNPKVKGDPRWTLSRSNPSEIELEVGDAYDVFSKYVKSAGQFIFTTPKLNDLSIVIHDETLKEAIIDKFTKQAWGNLESDIKFNLQIATNKDVDYVSRLANELISNAIIATLGWKWWSALKQVPSFVNYATQMPVGAFMRFAPGAIMNFKSNWERIQKEYPLLKSRYTDAFPAIWGSEASMYEEGITGLFGNGAVRDQKKKNKLALAAGIHAKSKEFFMKPIRYGDFAAVSLGATIYEQYLKEQIESDPETKKWTAQKKHDFIEQALVEATETTQQSGLNTTKGKWQRSDSALARSLFAFTSQNAQYVRKMREAIWEYRNGKMSRADMIKSILNYGILAPFIYNVLSNPAMYLVLWKGLLGDDDDRWKDELYLSAVRPFVDNVFSAWGGIGGIVTTVADISAQRTGQKTYGVANGVIDPFLLKDFVKAVKTLGKEGMSGEEFLDSALGLVQFGVPVPLQNIKKMLKGIGKTFTEEQILYMGMTLGISENQVKRIIEETEE